MIRTYRYRVKDSALLSKLEALSRAVNAVWNFCNETQIAALRWDKRWPNYYTLCTLTAGTSRELGLHSQTVQAVCEQYSRSRQQHHKARLRWRGNRSLGWIPFKASGIKIDDPGIYRYQGLTLKTWHSRHIPEDAKIKTGSICRDATGRWYINITFETQEQPARSGGKAIGIDLGLKSLATMSDGTAIEQSRFYRDLEPQLAVAQRARHKARVSTLHRKIRNRRNDHLHKLSTGLVKVHGLVVVGDINAKAIAKTKMAKSSLDAGWTSFRDMLRYKAMTRGAIYLEVDEAFSTQTCSVCGSLPASRPKGIAGLGIRAWTCSECGAEHHRDVNAARNILAAGHRRLAEGIPTSSG